MLKVGKFVGPSIPFTLPAASLDCIKTLTKLVRSPVRNGSRMFLTCQVKKVLLTLSPDQSAAQLNLSEMFMDPVALWLLTAPLPIETQVAGRLLTFCNTALPSTKKAGENWTDKLE